MQSSSCNASEVGPNILLAFQVDAYMHDLHEPALLKDRLPPELHIHQDASTGCTGCLSLAVRDVSTMLVFEDIFAMQDVLMGGAAGSWSSIRQQLLPFTHCPISTPPTPPTTYLVGASQLAAAMEAAAGRTHSALAALQRIHHPTHSVGVLQPTAGVGTHSIAHSTLWGVDCQSLIMPLRTAWSARSGAQSRLHNAEVLQGWVDAGRAPGWDLGAGCRMPIWMMHDERGVIASQARQLAHMLPTPCYGEHETPRLIT